MTLGGFGRTLGRRTKRLVNKVGKALTPEEKVRRERQIVRSPLQVEFERKLAESRKVKRRAPGAGRPLLPANMVKVAARRAPIKGVRPPDVPGTRRRRGANRREREGDNNG